MKPLSLIAMAIYLAAFATTTAGPDDVPDKAHKIRPLLVGTKIPESKVRSLDGTDFNLNQAVASKPTILIFYRGGW